MAYSRRLELKTINRMIQIYCRDHHRPAQGRLCEDCRQLLDYAEKRMDKCPYGEAKPVCSQCTIHCYKPEMRENIRAVMAYAGPRMLARSPVLTIRYLYRKKFKPPPRS